MKKILKEIKKFSQVHHRKYSPPFDHILNVEKFALKLAKDKKVDLDIIKIACYLHDIVHGVKKHAKLSAEKAKKILDKYNLSNKFLKKVTNCIAAHHNEIKATCPEAQILREADALELTTHLAFSKKD
jgi:HD superfamily phosphodiesterase